MESTSSNRTKKFLQLLNQAQNTAFVGLVGDNLKIELSQKPSALLKVLQYIVGDLARSQNDFARLKISECLIPQTIGEFIKEGGGEALTNYIINQKLNSERAGVREKTLEKLKRSILCLDLQDHFLEDNIMQRSNQNQELTMNSIKQKLSVNLLTDMTKYNRNFFADLIFKYQPLLSELASHESDSKVQQQSKEDLKDVVGNELMSAFGKAKAKLKLSDFIDEEFFEDIDSMQVDGNDKHQKIQLPLSQLFQQIGEQSSNENETQLFDIPASTKRKKISQDVNGFIQPQFCLLSPMLALLIHNCQIMLSDNWFERQAGANVIKSIISIKEIREYLKVDIIGLNQETQKYAVQTNIVVSLQNVVRNIMTNLFILLLKDEFNDFEELKLLTPVREEALTLFMKLQEFPEACKDFEFILQNLPIILKSAEQSTWKARYNFFLIMKGLLVNYRKEVFQAFNKVLIESLIIVEEEPRVIITEIIEILIPHYLQLNDYQKQIGLLLNNLQINLQQSDEIETSAIAVFNLTLRLFEAVPIKENFSKDLNFQISLDAVCPFNFHKITNVRYSYNLLIQKCVQTLDLPLEEIKILFRLTLQALVVERQKNIVKQLYINLRALVTILTQDPQDYIEFISYLMNECQFFIWLYSYQITSFESFLFYESERFDRLNADYYKIIQKPITSEEIQQFYFGKVKNLSKALAIMITDQQQIGLEIKGFLDQTTAKQDPNKDIVPQSDCNLINILAIIYNYQTFGTTCLNIEQLSQCVNECVNVISEEHVSIYHYKDIESIKRLLNILWQKLEQSQMQNEFQQLQQIYQGMEQCFQESRLCNLGFIQQKLEEMIMTMGTTCQIEEIYQCFNDMTQLFTQMFESATTLCRRLKVLGSILHIQMVKDNKVQLTNQMNNIIKPLVNSLKLEKVQFLQKLVANYIGELLSLLKQKGKINGIQQILKVIYLGIEKHGGPQNEAYDIGLKFFIKCVLKKHHNNIYKAYDDFFYKQICSNIKDQQYQEWVHVNLFLLRLILVQPNNPQEIYQDIGAIIQNQFEQIFKEGANFEGIEIEVPQLCLKMFTLFPSQQIQLISLIVKQMELKSKVAFMSLRELLDSMNSDILKFIPVFIIPVIKSIQYSRQIFNDDKQITQILATLLQLLPLNLTAISDYACGQESGMVAELKQQAVEGFNFLQIFVNNQMVTPYEMVIPVRANLRDYQKQGLTWLASLGKYNLNCALCDDMGLGKTLQSLCVILNESYIRQQATGVQPINLIICPTTITYNWHKEVQKFFPQFKSVVYEGSTVEKTKIIKEISKYNILIVSYDKVRGDIQAFKTIKFFYVVLDEGHMIKNAKSKTAQAVKDLVCDKKIVLTGTPLQNRVSELWSIFDFLMPGFLEEEGDFGRKYNQYLTTNIKKLSEKLEESQSFLQALKSLKKRIAPFILRRTKTDVLKELPPKIIQDYPCHMGTFQEYVHKMIEKNYPISQALQQAEQGKTGKNILNNLILHRKVCNHPVFVLEHLEADTNIKKHKDKNTQKEICAFSNSGKLSGLVDLLFECEIIDSKKFEESKKEESKSNKQNQKEERSDLIGQLNIDAIQQKSSDSRKHRVLLFCQMKKFMELIVAEVLEKYEIKYMQLSSSHSGKQRVDIVEQFNNDESVSVLILTTAVGGLGLNLTGADTVIFAEHDWNPMKDLQAIDRAHRIGQTRTVNVYRLIVADTLEEKIMSLQRFKENLAKSLVQSQGASTDDVGSLEMTDLLKSFEEHSSYNDQVNKKKPQLEDKIASNLDSIWRNYQEEE